MRILSLLLAASCALAPASFARAQAKLARARTSAPGSAVASSLRLAPIPWAALPPPSAVQAQWLEPTPRAAATTALPAALSALKTLNARLSRATQSVAQAQTRATLESFERVIDGSGERAEVAEPVFAEAARDASTTARGPPRPKASGAQRRLEDIKRLKVGTYNIFNLFEMVGKWVPDPNHAGRRIQVTQKELKPDWQLRESAKAIREMDPDVITLQEVENVKALEQFNQKYLGGAYRTLLLKGNDERGIDVGFLVKKDIPFDIEHRTHKGETWNDPSQGGRQVPLFSRDLPSLVVRAPGRAQPLFVIFGTHFKSKRDRSRDPQSRTLRRAQVERTAEIVARYRREFGPKVPIMLAGDFNGELNREPEFEALRRAAGLVDSLDLVRPPLPYQDRITHTYHPTGGPADKKQIDAVMVSESMKGVVVSASVYRYKDEHGNVKPIPDTYEERSKNPSDHFPVLVILDFPPLLAGRN